MEKPNPNFIVGAIIGVVAAAAAVLFLTPFSGPEIRKRFISLNGQTKGRKSSKSRAQKHPNVHAKEKDHEHAKTRKRAKLKTAAAKEE
jgi:gas vesicle protein